MKEQETRERNPRSYSQGGGKMRPKERSPIVVGLAVFALAIASMACGYLVTQDGQLIEQPDQAVEAFELPEAAQEVEVPQPLVVEVPEEGQAEEQEEGQVILPAEGSVPLPELTDFANPVFYPLRVEYEPLGNGMQTVTVWFGIQNASSQWHSYALHDRPMYWPKKEYTEADGCLGAFNWGRYVPILRTSEGGEYEVLGLLGGCSPRSVPAIPPGMVVTGFGATFSSAFPFGVAKFEIPENSNPESIEFQFNRSQFGGIEDRSVRYDRSWRPVYLSFDSEYAWPTPFDPAYEPPIFQTGEPIKAGEFAEVVFTSSANTDGSFSIEVTITSTHPLYSLEVNSVYSIIMLVDEDGVICCFKHPREWGMDWYTSKIGPGQSRTYSATFQTNGKEIWLFGQLLFEEDSPAEAIAHASFVVELP